MLNQNHYQNELDLPLGISMAAAQNPLVLKIFTDLTPEQRESLVRSVGRRGEESSFVTGKNGARRDIHIYD